MSITLPTIADQTVLAGAPLNLGLDVTSSTGNAINYTVSVSNPALNASVPQGNPSLKLVIDDNVDNIHGTLVFQLSQDLTPKTVEKIVGLANGDFYNNLTFHRIIKDFMIQGGDPLGTGSGGPGFQFDDEFNAALRFTSPGLLAMANSGDDTNGSQFFITTTNTRWLDFNHTIFGVLTEGSTTLAQLNSVPTNLSTNKPINNVVITDASVLNDTQNGVLRLSAPRGTTGAATVTVTATDSVTRESVSKTFNVTVAADTTNDPPFLGQINPIVTSVNTPVTFNLPATDVEGDAINYGGSVTPANANLTLSVNPSTGQSTLTPAANLAPGVYSIKVGVFQGNNSWDTQFVPVYINPAAPSSITLLPASDTGSSNSDRITSLNNTPGKTLSFQVNGVISGANVQLFSDGVLIGSASALGTSVIVTTNGTTTLADGIRSITAKQVLQNQAVNVGNLKTTTDLASAASSALSITIDTTSQTATINKSTFHGDFNGDGTSDVLWQNQNDGTVGAWIIKNGAINSWAGLGQANPTAWKIVGIGDFNSDGTSDILWQNQSTGLVGAWIIKNGALNGWVSFSSADPTVWKVVGLGDFNDDGSSDILWQNQSTGLVGSWIIKNGALNSWAGFGQADPTAWKIVGIGDFNGDGASDILWQNQSTGLVGSWIIKNATLNSWAGLGQADPTVWKITGIGDFNADKTSDVLWKNQTTGLVGAWIIKNATLNGWAGGDVVSGVDIVGTGDYNGDRTSDILWHNPSTGYVGTYILQNATVSQYKELGSADPLVWKIAGGGQASSSTLHAVNEVVAASDVASLAQSELQLIVHEAIARWARTGLDASSIARLTQVDFAIDDLNGSLLGKAEANRVTLDINAAGHGWFIDPTPTLDEEYSVASGTRLKAIDPRAVDRIDLLSVVEHELGHILGLADLNALADNVMSGVLESGVRKTPYKRHVDAAFAAV